MSDEKWTYENVIDCHIKVFDICPFFQSISSADEGLNRPKQSRSEKKARKVRVYKNEWNIKTDSLRILFNSRCFVSLLLYMYVGHV